MSVDGGRSVTRARVSWIWLVVGTLTLVVAVAWLAVPWSWSMVDDPGFALGVRAAIDEHGFLPGLADHAIQMARGDVGWGLFRPAYWVYPSLIYWLPIGLAHLVRLLFLVAAISGPLVYLRRRGAGWRVVTVAAAVMLSGATTLMFGLFNVSLQELSGAAFVGLGLWVRGSWPRLLLWTVAAWFKSPFSWLLVAQAVVLWRAGQRRSALAYGGVAMATLGAAAVMARNGEYTALYATDRLSSVVVGNLTLLLDLSLILPVALASSWLVLARQRPMVDGMSVTFGVGAAGYTLQMLPWAVTGYYQGPIAYLLTSFLALLLTNAESVSRARLRLAVLLPVLIAVPITVASVWSVLHKNARFRGVTDCMVANSGARFIVGREFGIEAAVRLAENARVTDPRWAGRVVFEDEFGPLTSAAAGDLLVIYAADRATVPPDATPVCETLGAAIVKVEARS